jgi:beta-lactamase class A
MDRSARADWDYFGRVAEARMTIRRPVMGIGRRRALFLGSIGLLIINSCAAVPQAAGPARSSGSAPVQQTVASGYPTDLVPGYSLRAPARPMADRPPPALAAMIESLGRSFNGTVGIAIESVDEGWSVAWNGEALFPQQSVSKLWVGMALLDSVDRGRNRLSDPVTLWPQDKTLFHQPIAELITAQGYTTSIADLFDRAMTQSDNTANDKLLRTIGGPEAVRGYLARRYVANIRFGPGERLLQSQTAGLSWSQDMAGGRRFQSVRAQLPPSVREKALNDYLASPPDGAAPKAIARTIARLARGEMLSPTSTQVLLGTMEDAKTGAQRVKAGVPAGWTYAHKTGTGQQLGGRSTGFNDVGLMTAPDGRRYALAVMIADTTAPTAQRWALMQSVSRTVAALHPPTYGQGGANLTTRR